MNNKVTIAVCGPSEYANHIADDIRKADEISRYKVVIYNSGCAALDNLYRYEAVFLDACMEDSYRTAEQLRLSYDIPVIFMTSYDDTLIRAARTKPFRFMPRNYTQEQMRDIINSLDCYFDGRLCRHVITLYCKRVKTAVFMEDIVYIQLDGYDAYVHMADKRIYKAFEEQLDYEYIFKNSFFVRSHNAYIINCLYVSRLDGYEVVFENGERLPTSRRRIGTVRTAFDTAKKYRRIT